MTQLVPVLSLIVAALAVFFGPIISWRIAKRQLEASQQIASRQLIGPMRQVWINDVRKVLVELLSSAMHYFVAGFEDRKDKEYRRLEELQQEVTLMLNPREDDHAALVGAIHRMIGALERGNSKDDQLFADSHRLAEELAQRVLKAEWNRVKEGT